MRALAVARASSMNRSDVSRPTTWLNASVSPIRWVVKPGPHPRSNASFCARPRPVADAFCKKARVEFSNTRARSSSRRAAISVSPKTYLGFIGDSLKGSISPRFQSHSEMISNSDEKSTKRRLGTVRRAKPIRSALFVPGNREDRMLKAPRFGADALILDLEDAVALADKPRSRVTVRKALEELGKAGQTLFVRVNDFETGMTGEDLEAVVCPHLYAVMLPKVTGPDDIKAADTLISFFERKNGMQPGSVLINPSLETAQGMRQAYEVAIASPRIAHMGGLTGKDGDIARAIGFEWTPEGHEALYYIAKVLLDARAANVPYPIGGRGWWDIQDLEGLRAEAIRTRQFGYTGMVLIHPSHVQIVNEVFTPTKEKIAHWKELIAAVEECER